MSDASAIRNAAMIDAPTTPDRRLSRAGAQIPSGEFRRSDRPGRHGAHDLERVRGRAHSAGLDSHRRARRRQDHDGAHPGARAQLRIAGRLGHRRRPSTCRSLGIHCQAIMESRHLDVIEMDAASHNGVDDVRQINDAIRYAPVSARYKVYILDEVHMLSGAAFNALLKTLEEPPPHAKFIFATTEIRKVPITVLSRCQRFDLRRVDAALLVGHLQGIAGKESIDGRAGGAGADRARRRRLGARRAVAVRPGDRPCGRSGARRGRAADAGACRPRPHHRSVRGADARRHAARARRTARPVRHRRRSGGGAGRSRRVHPFRHAA